MIRTGARTYAFTVGGLACNLIAGVIIARALGPADRGSITAILNASMFMSWVVGMGAAEALSFRRAKVPEDGPALLSTWLLLLLPLGIAGSVALYFLYPVFLAAQTEEVLSIASYFAPAVAMSILNQICYGALLGSHDYKMFNWVKFLPWAGIALGYAFLLAIGELGVVSALVTNVASFLLVDALALLHMQRRHGGFGRPTTDLAKITLGYGVKAHGSNVGLMVSARLDLLIMPAFLAATSVGLYSVGTNVSWLVVAIAGAIAPIVLPAASREGGGSKVVSRSLLATLVVGSAMAVALAAVGYPLIKLVYGNDFSSSYLPMLILLPGCVAFAASQVLWSGINAEGRPLVSAATQVPGVVITVVGLITLLGPLGINGAAAISTIAYVATFVAALLGYRRLVGLTTDDISTASQDLRAGLSSMRKRLKDRRASRAAGGDPA